MVYLKSFLVGIALFIVQHVRNDENKMDNIVA